MIHKTRKITAMMMSLHLCTQLTPCLYTSELFAASLFILLIIKWMYMPEFDAINQYSLSATGDHWEMTLTCNEIGQ